MLQTMNYFPHRFIEKVAKKHIKADFSANLEERFEDRCARFLTYSNFYIWDLQKSSGSFNSYFEQEIARRNKECPEININHYSEAMVLPLFGSIKKVKIPEKQI